MLVSDVGTGLESPRGLPDETIVRAIRVIDRTTTVSLALLGLLILVRIVAGPAGLVDWLTALAVLVVGAGLLVQRGGAGHPPPPHGAPRAPAPPPRLAGAGPGARRRRRLVGGAPRGRGAAGRAPARRLRPPSHTGRAPVGGRRGHRGPAPLPPPPPSRGVRAGRRP